VTDSDRPRLRDLLVADYDHFFKRLTLRLRSQDAAVEALHETFLRLDRMNDPVVQRPKEYIFRAAINIAKNLRKAESYRAGASEVAAIFDVPDAAPNSARIVEARSDIEALKRALAELPARRREVLSAISIEGASPREVAARLQVSLRTVEIDLRQALQHCADRLSYKMPRRTGGPRPRC
jgi:RNA polymerase sigma factor (sigma-70 family)